MFTEIIEIVGIIEAVEPSDDLTRQVVDAEPIANGVEPGDSVAVNGGCLTVTSICDGWILPFCRHCQLNDRQPTRCLMGSS